MADGPGGLKIEWRRERLLLGGAVVVAFAAVLCLAREQSAQRRAARREASEFHAAMRRARPLSAIAPGGDCVLSIDGKARGTVLVAMAPSRRSRLTLRSRPGGLVLEYRRGDRVCKSAHLGRVGDGQLRVFRTGRRLEFCPPAGVARRADLAAGWKVWLVGPPGGEAGPAWRVSMLGAGPLRDDFMRTTFPEAGDGWQVERGDFAIVRQGRNESHSANAFYLRAAPEPTGAPSDDGPAAARPAVAVTGRGSDGNYTVQVSARAETQGASYRVEAGSAAGARVGFGWNDAHSRWELTVAHAGRRRVLASRRMVPMPGNWRRIGLRFKSATEVDALLDGVALARRKLPQAVWGRVRLVAEDGPADFDDFALTSGAPAPPQGVPLFVQSKAFSKKEPKPDDDDFVKWAKDTICVERTQIELAGGPYPALSYALPLYGNFDYEARVGRARRLLLRCQAADGETEDFEFVRDGAHWRSTREPPLRGAAQRPGEAASPPLRLACRSGKLFRLDPGRTLVGRLWEAGPHMVTVCAFGEKMALADHDLRSFRLWDEFFEQAPTQWRWWTGQLGMQYRWACQPYWNFMGGWSRGAALCFSRDIYTGSQTIEYYVSLKHLLAGHGGLKYILKDMNFSFCTDGRQPGSGYSLLIGGWNNAGVFLLKGDRVVASNNEVKIARTPRVSVHHRWWHVRVEKRGGSIEVQIDEKPVLKYVDKEPLSGGRLAFWTVANGFILARVRVAAEGRRTGSSDFWGAPSDTCDAWEPIEPACVRLRTEGDGVRVVNRIGGGSFGVRRVGESVDLTRKPLLKLPLRVGPGALVSLHLQVSGKPFLIPVTAPTEETFAVLCPVTDAVGYKEALYGPAVGQYVTGAAILPAAVPKNGVLTVNLARALGALAGPAPRLESLIVGNASNKDYLLAGLSGNRAGAHYVVGRPMFLAPETSPVVRTVATIQ